MYFQFGNHQTRPNSTIGIESRVNKQRGEGVQRKDLEIAVFRLAVAQPQQQLYGRQGTAAPSGANSVSSLAGFLSLNYIYDFSYFSRLKTKSLILMFISKVEKRGSCVALRCVDIETGPAEVVKFFTVNTDKMNPLNGNL